MVLDSIFTLKWAALGWIAGAIVVCLAIDRALSALLGLPLSLFAMFAVVMAAYLVVAFVYTAAKWALGRLHPDE